MGTVNRNISRFEVTGVFTHPAARVDIVLVHGLNGQPERTWTAENGVFWPTDLLPVSLRDTPANILVYGYNADVYSRGNGSTASDNFVFQHAQTLVAHLTTYRRSERTTTNPIIWVAHSLGGIVLKRALLYSNDLRVAEHEAYRSIYVSTHSIIFLGTPHTGSGLATWGRVLQGMSDAIVPRKFFESESILLKTLKKDNERLQEINSHFLDIYQRFHIHMVHENHKTNLKGTKALVVDADSASPQLPGVTYYGIEATHSGMCKFSSNSAPGYRIIATAIQEWVVEAPQIIEKRWAVERKEREDSARHDAEERQMHYLPVVPVGDGPSDQDSSNSDTHKQLVDAGHDTEIVSESHGANSGTPHMQQLPSTTPMQSSMDIAPTKLEPLFIHPEPFRGNSYFVGRKKEMADLHDRLTDPVRRSQGTSAVVIHSLTGGGKTHLARQYVFSHRDDYPGGIFWVRAKSIPEMEQFYWSIAKTAAPRTVVQCSMGRASPVTPSDAETRRGLSNPKNVVDMVRQWFSSFDQWLLVFDGILFNTPGIARFIPDARNTSIIYTSIQSGVSGRYEFDNPQVLRLGMLSPDEAQELLLTEMEKKKPWLHDDCERAREIVRLMDYFPLMIHTAAQHLKATHEPLHKYLRAYRTRTPAGDLSAFRAVWIDLKDRGATPALNLIYILAFFDSRIPVGLLHLGLGALDKRTPVLTRDATHRSRSLNNSLRTLMAFALLERSEAGTIVQTSSQSSSKRSDSLGPDPIDLLRINSVVQSFFIDVLASSKQAGFWLERAAAVFCRSFNEAERHIKENPKLGLLDDFRCFQMNGEKLLEHLTRILDSKKPDPLFDALVEAKEGVVSRLAVCSSAIDRLSEASEKYINTEMDLNNPTQEDTSMVSVFEHASSASDWEDSTTPSSQNSVDSSILSFRTGTGLSRSHSFPPASTSQGRGLTNSNVAPTGGGPGHTPKASNGKNMGPPLDIAKAMGKLVQDDTPLHRSPEHFSAPLVPGGDNPYHWHVPYTPYPPDTNFIPAPPMPGDSFYSEMDEQGDETTTVVPTPRLPEPPVSKKSWNPPPFLFQNATLSEHRTVRRKHKRRYHDSAGSWRDEAADDPRTGKPHSKDTPITVSREVAKGSMYVPKKPSSASSSSVGGKLSAGSEAEMALSRIHASGTAPASSRIDSLPVLKNGDLADDEGTSAIPGRGKGRAQSTGAMGVRPHMNLRREEAARRSRLNEVFSEENSEPRPAVPAPGSQEPKNDPQSPSPWTMLKRLQENILPSWLVGKQEQGQQQQQQQQQQHENQQSRVRVPDWAENMLGTAIPSTWRPYADTEDEQVLSKSINSLLEAQTSRTAPMSRTSRSSPANSYGPFTPPQPLHYSFHHYAAAPLSPQMDNRNNGHARLRSSQTHIPAGAKVHRWTQEVYYTTSDEPLSDTELDTGFGHGHHSAAIPYAPRMSYAYGYPSSAAGHFVGRAAELRATAPATGYTSQPMSRNTSGQSHGEHMAAAGGGQLFDPAVMRAVSSRGEAIVGSTPYDDYNDEDDDVLVEASGLSQSMPAPGMFYGGRPNTTRNRRDSVLGSNGSIDSGSGSGTPMASSRPIPISHLRRMSRSSLVETEPSPRTDNPFADVHTSYQLYEERRAQAGGGGGGAGTSGSSVNSDGATGVFSRRARVPRSSLHKMSLDEAMAALEARRPQQQPEASGAAGAKGTAGKVLRPSYSDSGLGTFSHAEADADRDTDMGGGEYEYENENERRWVPQETANDTTNKTG